MNTERVQLSAEATDILMRGGDEAVQLALGIERDKRYAVRQQQAAEGTMTGLEQQIDRLQRINGQLSSDKHTLVSDLSAVSISEQRGREIISELNRDDDVMIAVGGNTRLLRAIQMYLGTIQ